MLSLIHILRTSAYADLIDQVFHAGFSVLLVWITVSTEQTLTESVLVDAASAAARGSMYGAMGGLLLLLFIFLIYKAKSTIFNAPAEQITERKSTLFKYFICLVIPIMIAASVSNLRELIDTALFKAVSYTHLLSVRQEHLNTPNKAYAQNRGNHLRCRRVYPRFFNP